MDRRMDPRNELHLRAAVERLAREGRSQQEIESTVIRMLGGKPLQPGLGARLRRVVGA